jgi:hypothetical protein
VSLQPAAAAGPDVRGRYGVAAVFALAVFAAWAFPEVDRLMNPGAETPGLISYLGVGLSLLALTSVLLFAGLRRILPRTGVFLGAAIGYNAMLILVKFTLSPLALYAVSSGPGFFVLNWWIAYPAIGAITALLYGLSFLILFLIFNSRVKRRLGTGGTLGKRVIQLLVVMFIIAGVGSLTGIGLFGSLEYVFSLAYVPVIGIGIALALVAALSLCIVAFHETAEQVVLTRNVTLLTTFAWVGLAFIAAYHILWLVFLLTLISIWPLKATSMK